MSGREPLPASFYERSTIDVAKDLLGKRFVVRSARGSVVEVRIVETEAYWGDDPASHSSRGKTPRSSPMFEAPGRAYVYLIYGMYPLLNFVTEKEGTPGAVLIRAAEVLSGEAQIRKRRKGKTGHEWMRGPGKLTTALGIQMRDNRASLLGPRFEVMDDGFRPSKILASPRIGISVAKDALLRFSIADHPCVSGPQMCPTN